MLLRVREGQLEIILKSLKYYWKMYMKLLSILCLKITSRYVFSGFLLFCHYALKKQGGWCVPMILSVKFVLFFYPFPISDVKHVGFFVYVEGQSMPLLPSRVFGRLLETCCLMGSGIQK
jgi:hypothetical protein